MDLLEFGMKNMDSESPVKKAAAKGALEVAKLHADLYEQYLEKKLPIPENEEETKQMLKEIQEQIKAQK